MPTESSAAGRIFSVGRVPELDGIRGVAILMVLLWHYIFLAVHPAPATFLSYAVAPLRLTWSGVDLFFVLSGFLIGGILLDRRDSSNYFKIFYIRRFFRIVPIYAAILLIFPVVIHFALNSHSYSFAWLTNRPLPWYSFWTFTQNFWMTTAGTFGSNGFAITWSLAVEEQFYLTLPFIVRFMPPNRLTLYVVAGICLAPLLRCLIYVSWGSPLGMYVLMPCRADALLLGVLAAIALRNPAWVAKLQNFKFALLFPILLAGLAFLTLKSPDPGDRFMATIGYTWLALFYVSVLVFVLLRPANPLSALFRMKWLRWLGLVAYSTYLFHQMIQGLLFGWLWKSPPSIANLPTFLTSLAALAICLLLAAASWHFFESPLIQVGHRSHYAASSGNNASLYSAAQSAVPE